MQETDSQSQEQATATKAASAPAKSRTLWGDAFKRLRKNKLAVIGVCWIIIVVVVALTAICGLSPGSVRRRLPTRPPWLRRRCWLRVPSTRLAPTP